VDSSTSENTVVWRVALEEVIVNDVVVMEDKAVVDEIPRQKLGGSFGATDVWEGPAVRGERRANRRRRGGRSSEIRTMVL
jgi:hypothetical protein